MAHFPFFSHKLQLIQLYNHRDFSLSLFPYSFRPRERHCVMFLCFVSLSIITLIEHSNLLFNMCDNLIGLLFSNDGHRLFYISVHNVLTKASRSNSSCFSSESPFHRLSVDHWPCSWNSQTFQDLGRKGHFPQYFQTQKKRCLSFPKLFLLCKVQTTQTLQALKLKAASLTWPGELRPGTKMPPEERWGVCFKSGRDML